MPIPPLRKKRDRTVRNGYWRNLYANVSANLLASFSTSSTANTFAVSSNLATVDDAGTAKAVVRNGRLVYFEA